MKDELDQAIREVRNSDDAIIGTWPPPSRDLIDAYERLTGLEFPEDYKRFLIGLGNVGVRGLTPLYLNENFEREHGELSHAIEWGREIGIPKDCLPICEDNGAYFCVVPKGLIRYWEGGEFNEEIWETFASWLVDVWLDDFSDLDLD